MVVDAATAGNAAAQGIFAHALQTLGWAIAQMITLVAPQIVVIGGGVPLAGESDVLRAAPPRGRPVCFPAAGEVLYDRPRSARRRSGPAWGAGGGSAGIDSITTGIYRICSTRPVEPLSIDPVHVSLGNKQSFIFKTCSTVS